MMHEYEVHTDATLVRRLLAGQFPDWTDLPIEPVASAGTDNALYRLGDDMVVRMPRIEWAIGQVAKEHEWLPRLAPALPLAIPEPLVMGEPGSGYPWQWAVHRWLDGENATLDRIADMRQATHNLADFILALRQIDVTGGPAAGALNFGRGVPLAERDKQTRKAIDDLRCMTDTLSIDLDAAAQVWNASVRAPIWGKPPVWLHGDLQSGNLLAVDGRLSAVIDFGGLGVGDPACDVMAAWVYLPRETRGLFRELLQADDAMWARARGWAISFALIALPYYVHTNPGLAGIAQRTIDEVLADEE